ncbi:MAG: AAA family ATPase [Chloroflexi bacterium]|nr:AAA family ATPase [Chloroflexota bacterium]
MHADFADTSNGVAYAPSVQLVDSPSLRSGQAIWADVLASRVLEMAAQTQIDRTAERQTLGLPTGIPGLDRVLNGLSPRGLYILGGAPGAGKTSLALQIACEVAKQTPVLYLTYENAPDDLVLKAICRLALVQPGAVERGRADLSRLGKGAATFATMSPRLAFVEGTSRLTLDALRMHAEQIVARHRATRCLIIVDYLQRMAVHQQNGSMADNISALSLGLRELASAVDSPILAISSLSRAGSYDSPTLQGLQGSEDLEFAADVVLLLGIRQDVSLSSKAIANATVGSRLLDLVVAKNRYGESFKGIPLLFRPTVGDFQEDTRA